MIHVETSVTIDRPAEEVFSVLSDLERQPDWVSSIQESEITSGGPVREGTTFRQVVKALGRRMETEATVTEYDPPRAFAFEGGAGPMRMTFRFTVSPEGTGSRIDQVVEGETKGFFKLADSIAARTMKKQFEADLATLKAVLESRSAATV